MSTTSKQRLFSPGRDAALFFQCAQGHCTHPPKSAKEKQKSSQPLDRSIYPARMASAMPVPTSTTSNSVSLSVESIFFFNFPPGFAFLARSRSVRGLRERGLLRQHHHEHQHVQQQPLQLATRVRHVQRRAEQQRGDEERDRSDPFLAFCFCRMLGRFGMCTCYSVHYLVVTMEKVGQVMAGQWL